MALVRISERLQGTPRAIAALLLLGALAVSAGAQDKPGSKDHPEVTRFKGATIEAYQTVDFDETAFPVRPTSDSSGRPLAPGSLLTVEGRITRINYQAPVGKSTLEVMRNYEQALAPAFKTVFSCAGDACGHAMASTVDTHSIRNHWRVHFAANLQRYLVAKRASPDGDVYLQVLVTQEDPARSALVFQQVVEVQPMQTSQVAVMNAASLKSGLDNDGKVAVYGVHFDTGKAEVQPASKPTLDEMAKLLQANRALKVYIVGHTDNAGTLAGNVDLSQRRADAIVRTLVSTYQVDAGRLVARGVASLAPVGTNQSAAGRAKNRRVELVVQ